MIHSGFLIFIVDLDDGCNCWQTVRTCGCHFNQVPDDNSSDDQSSSDDQNSSDSVSEFEPDAELDLEEEPVPVVGQLTFLNFFRYFFLRYVRFFRRFPIAGHYLIFLIMVIRYIERTRRFD